MKLTFLSLWCNSLSWLVSRVRGSEGYVHGSRPSTSSASPLSPWLPAALADASLGRLTPRFLCVRPCRLSLASSYSPWPSAMSPPVAPCFWSPTTSAQHRRPRPCLLSASSYLLHHGTCKLDSPSAMTSPGSIIRCKSLVRPHLCPSHDHANTLAGASTKPRDCRPRHSASSAQHLAIPLGSMSLNANLTTFSLPLSPTLSAKPSECPSSSPGHLPMALSPHSLSLLHSRPSQLAASSPSSQLPQASSPLAQEAHS